MSKYHWFSAKGFSGLGIRMATKDSFIFRTVELKYIISCDKSFNEKQHNFTFYIDTLDVLQLYAKQYSLNTH